MAAADGSWDLTIFITDMNVEQTIRTRGDLHVAGLMLKIVNAVGKSTDDIKTAGRVISVMNISLRNHQFADDQSTDKTFRCQLAR